ncbi:FAD-binding oxidoreductase [Luteolibacter flavescens]|uniref:FAD-binding oxidoreductase n=1 Tax=Luteolibacter flavescens TaxID=1859460 RepID=A0ABT3FNL4_9BACT|nr:FAD-dependent oxidoreductase [Luteolibacter flavescens]MCW1885163.1 FAD-binding oxidoreductase [Luteolibacter flavescens]
MASAEDRQIVIAGGGFFGCSIALMLRQRGWQPVIVEENDDLLTRASQVNQARVHGGYHYPRSLMTAYRSRRNYERFREKYREAIVDRFTKVYAVGRYFSKVTAGQFEMFMKRIGAPLEEAPASIARLFNPALTEKCWIAEECAFDHSILREKLRRELEDAGVGMRFGERVIAAESNPHGALARLSGGAEIPCRLVVNATYAGLNLLTSGSGLPVVPLKHELTELALIELPGELKDLSVTMMCGPFFSFMPYPARGLTSLSHVRYTPHAQWYENTREGTGDPYRRFDTLAKESHQQLMLADASRYLPALRDATYRESIWAVKTLLPQTETDDGRPILFQRDPVLPSVIHVMGGKIDNIFDVEDELAGLLSARSATAA